MSKHATIPVFVPHAACPNLCVFCNQKKIAGAEIDRSGLAAFLENAVMELDDSFDSVDIAFFGGSFTGIGIKNICGYLSEAYKQLEKGRVTGIRLSTRPDYISAEILDLLAIYGVTAVEIGVQSLDDGVLKASKRGHTAECSEKAAYMIKERGFELCLQLMPGLPGDTPETVEATLNKAAEIMPAAVRLYPCTVIRDTEMELMYYRGEYTPLTVSEAVTVCANAYESFTEKGLKILRMGLHSSDLSQNDGVVAGPYHPAFGELVRREVYYRKADRLLYTLSPKEGEIYLLTVGKGDISLLTGNCRESIKKLEARYGITVIPREGEAKAENGEIKLSAAKQ